MCIEAQFQYILSPQSLRDSSPCNKGSLWRNYFVYRLKHSLSESVF